MPSPKREAPGAGPGLLAPLGAIVALALPYAVLSLASAEAAREAKLAAQAAGAALVALGLGRASAARLSVPVPPRASRAAKVALGALLVLLALFALSFAVGVARGREILDAFPLLPVLVLLAWGAAPAGEATARRALAVVVACGAATGLLAALQRFAGVLRLPVDAPEPRFFATALIGNPGDVGAALVIPALLAATSFARGERRLASGAAFLACVAGLGAAGTLAPLVAFAAGAAILVACDLRRRLPAAAAAAVVVLAILAASGVVGRAAAKLTSGSVATLTTQRDIGVLSALETIRAHPLLGTGPGGFASDFVRARLAAEKRVGRRLVHLSTSAHFDNAHCDPLTTAAELGIPAALAAVVALAALLALLPGAVRRERTAPPGGLVPAEALLAGLGAVLVLSLANFPVQIVPVSGPFALLAGLALGRAGGRLPVLAPRRVTAGLVLAALALVAGASLRTAGARTLAFSEGLLKAAPGSPDRRDILGAALEEARRAVALRPRHAASLLALGSARAALGDVDGAVDAMERSRSFEERAETLLDLGRLAVARGDARAARPFFVRAVWVLPRLVDAIPPAGEPDAVLAEVKRLEGALGSGGAPPPDPPDLRRR